MEDLDSTVIDEHFSNTTGAFITSSEAGNVAALHAPPELAKIIRQAFINERNEEVRAGMRPVSQIDIKAPPSLRFEQDVIWSWQKQLERYRSIPDALNALIRRIRLYPGLAEALELSAST